jgi:dihydroxyacetone kinase-like predicted kinase
MVSINEELEAAKAARAAIKALLTATSKSEVLATLKKSGRVVILNFSSGGALNEARGNVGIALSNIMHGLPTPEKIDKAKSAIDAWIVELEAAKLKRVHRSNDG